MGDPRFALFFSLIPLIAFFVIERYVSLGWAVAVSAGLAVIEVVVQRVRTGKNTKMSLFSAALILVLGGMSWLSDNPRFVLWSPVIGDLALGAVLLGSLWGGSSMLGVALAEQQEEPLHPLQVQFARGITLRLALNILLHGVFSGMAVEASRETWLFVTGPLQYLMIGAQVAVEAVYARLVLLPRLDAEDP